MQVTEEFLRSKLRHERDEKLHFAEKAKMYDKLTAYLRHEGLNIGEMLKQAEELHLQLIALQKNKDRSR